MGDEHKSICAPRPQPPRNGGDIAVDMAIGEEIAQLTPEQEERFRHAHMGYFSLGKFPRDDVEAAAKLLVAYRAAKLTGPEFGSMFFRVVNDPDAVLKRADELERSEPQPVGDDLVVTPPGEDPPPFDFKEFLREQAEKQRK